MISQRRAAQLGLLSAALVFTICIGVLISHGSGSASSVPASSGGLSSSHQNQSLPIALSASSDKQ
jgi:hypothetical protein